MKLNSYLVDLRDQYAEFTDLRLESPFTAEEKAHEGVVIQFGMPKWLALLIVFGMNCFQPLFRAVLGTK